MAFLERRLEHQERLEVAERPFYIVSDMNGKVLDVEGACAEPGTKVVTYHRHGEPRDNQLWYVDEGGHIHSRLNMLVFDTASGELRVELHEPGKPEQEWCFEGEKIVNRVDPSRVLDIYHSRDHNGQRVIPYEYHGSNNQHWHIEYVTL